MTQNIEQLLSSTFNNGGMVALISAILLGALTYRFYVVKNRTKQKVNTEHNRLIEQLTESNAELERFAFVASHDLREPIRLICSFADLLRQEYADQLDENAQKYIGIISMATHRMNDLVEDLLDYARIGNENEKPDWFESQGVLDYVLEMLGVSIRESGAEITHGTMPYIISSRTRFMLLLQNLISNAIKYHRDGVKPVIHIAGEEKQTEWVFSVKDNGIGIKPEYNTQIFEPFKRLHSQSEYEGTGMGLAICRKIIDRKRGKLWVESPDEGGSIFYFTIPKPDPSL